MSPVPRESGAGWTRPWWLLLGACAALLTLLGAALIQLSEHYFVRGYNSFVSLDTWQGVAQFGVSALVLDLFVVLLAWTLVLPVLRRLPIEPVHQWALAAILGLAGPVGFTFFRYQLQRYLGDLADLDLILTLADGWSLELLAQSSGQLLPVLLTAMLVSVLVAVGFWWFVRYARRNAERLQHFVTPGWRATAIPLLATGLLSGVLLPAHCLNGSPVCRGLVVKPAGSIVGRAVEFVTDVDRDGSGLMSTPPDPAPFDASVHAYALEVPGNGRDENGIAGDLPADFRLGPEPAEHPGKWTRRPHVLLIFGESLRGDVVDRKSDGRFIAPYLRKLGLEGASSRHGYTNVPYTSKARAQLFGGRVDPYDGQDTIVGDFKANGYFVAHFSGQDDSFGGRSGQLGRVEPDHYYDARDDQEKRSSRFTTSGSLAVSWKVLNQRIGEFLDGYDADDPLFLYVNYHDTHFPYHHAEMDRILDVEPLSRGEITPERREELWDTYANAVANVDRGIERLVERLRKKIGDDELVILVTADHGESLFDFGYLGHGQSLNAEQTRVPMIIWGIGGDWPEPMGIADLRGLVQKNLSLRGEDGRIPKPRLVAPRGRKIFQYTSRLERPRILALRGINEALHYAVRRGVLELESPTQTRRVAVHEMRDRFDGLVHTWEAHALREYRNGGRDG